MNLFDFKLYVLPGKCPRGFEFVGLYNEVYRFWESIYQDVYKKSNHPESLNPDNFYLQDEVLAITYGEQVVGCILFSYHNTQCDSAFKLKYFKDLSQNMILNIKNQAPHSMMLMESLTVHPQFRKSKIGFSLSECLLGFSAKFFLQSKCDVLVGTPRTDVKVHKMCQGYGGNPIGEIIKSNYPCEVFVYQPQTTKVSLNSSHNLIIRRLLTSRIDTKQKHLENISKIERNKIA